MEAICYLVLKLISNNRIYNIFPLNNSFFQFLNSVTLRKACFMTSDLKQKLHRLIDACNDEFLLEEARAVLESPQTGQEFFEELDDEDRETFLEAEEEHEQGHTATHNRLMHQFEAFKKK
jgi:hypothetical protein